MIDSEFLRSSLEALLVKTQNCVPGDGYWVGDAAGKRRCEDDQRSGALAIKSAHENARRGLDYLAKGQGDMAIRCLVEGYNVLIAAFARQISPDDFEVLITGARRRGRHSTTVDRNVALALAVEATGLSGPAARHAAFKANPDLALAFAQMGDAGVRKALREGKTQLSAQKNS